MLLGEGREMAHLGVLSRLDEAWKWEFTDIARIGTDLRLRLISAAPFASAIPISASAFFFLFSIST